MGYLGEQIPKLGFGLMRLPMLGEDVDIEQTKEMVDRFLNAGFTYFDTAFGYLGGKNELAIGEALVISDNTAKAHIRSIYAKTGVHTRQEFIDATEHVMR